MAHAIDMSNGRANMAFVGQTPWHGLGQQLPEGQTIEQWCEAAGMNYQIMRAMVQYNNGQLHEYPGNEVLYRSDTSAPLGIVSDGYKVVQPAEVLEFFRDLTDAPLHTAGVLKGGALYWALAKTGHSAEIGRDDRTDGYLLLSSSADGTRATDARFTAIRVVCNNTLSMAMNVGGTGAVKTRHSTQFSARATKQALGLINFDAAWQEFRDTMTKLQQRPVGAAEATSYFADLLRPAGMRAAPRGTMNASTLDVLLGAPVGGGVMFAKTDGDARAIRGLADLEHSYYDAPGAVPGTAYGLVQGVTHYVDHVRGKSVDKRLTSAWFGQGDTLKQAAVDRAVAMAA
jgi:phage/plasmid-like protein (TIGR03299 family)